MKQKQAAFAAGLALFAAGVALAGTVKYPVLTGVQSHSSPTDPARELLDLLDHQDPAVRARAARALKDYVLDSRVERRLLDVLDRYGEQETVRRAAVKSLSAAPNDGTRRRLLDLARRTTESANIREISFKALWLAASTEPGVRSALHDALRNAGEAQIQAAAAWTLFAAEQDYATRRLLVDLARDPGAPLQPRIEAVKSLMIPMIHYEVRGPVMDLAQNLSADERLREAAILSLMGANNDYQVRVFLERAANNESAASLRRAAVSALGELTLEWARYFHLGGFRSRGRVITLDPIEDQ